MMKTIQLILRIIVSPIVLFITFGGMSLFPGPICLFMGLGVIIGKLLGVDTGDNWKELLLFTFMWFIYPILSTKSFIIYAKIPD